MQASHLYAHDALMRTLPESGHGASRECTTEEHRLLARVSSLQRENEALGAANRRLLLDIKRLERLVYLDPLTGLGNRRYFDVVLDSEIRRSARTRQPLTLLLCDVDYFKQYNDAYGHGLGDAALVRIGKALAASCRRGGERAARIGGEEFALVFPNVDAENASAVAENIRKHISGLRIRHNHSEIADRVTISIGATTFQSTAPCQAARLVDIADTALYQAKRAGRNRSKIRTIPQICEGQAIAS